MRVIHRGALLASWVALSSAGCYRSHTRPEDAAVSDAPTDAPSSVPGCRARCEPPRLAASVILPTREAPWPRAFADARSVDDTIVVLMTAPLSGHSPPGHRLLFVDVRTGEVRVSDPWTASGLFPQHHNGARIVAADDAHIGVIALVGRPHFADSTPTGRQAVSVHYLEWSWDGELTASPRLTSFPDEDTLGCPGGCEAGVAVRGDRAVVSYAPEGLLRRTEIDIVSRRAEPWIEERPIDDPDPTPWPHRAAFYLDEHWVAGGGTPDLATPRRPFVVGPEGEEAIVGTEHDAPPLLLGGDSLVLARHVQAPAQAYRVRRVRPGEPVQALDVTTSGIGALSGWLARDGETRLVLAWTSLAPGSLRDTLVSVVSDTPFERCGVVEPTTIAMIPNGIVAPSILAHPHGGALYVMALSNQPNGRQPELVVFELRGCAMVE